MKKYKLVLGGLDWHWEDGEREICDLRRVDHSARKADQNKQIYGDQRS